MIATATDTRLEELASKIRAAQATVSAQISTYLKDAYQLLAEKGRGEEWPIWLSNIKDLGPLKLIFEGGDCDDPQESGIDLYFTGVDVWLSACISKKLGLQGVVTIPGD